eukprot:2292162-Rhodomonas_salina.1
MQFLEFGSRRAAHVQQNLYREGGFLTWTVTCSTWLASACATARSAATTVEAIDWRRGESILVLVAAGVPHREAPCMVRVFSSWESVTTCSCLSNGCMRRPLVAVCARSVPDSAYSIREVSTGQCVQCTRGQYRAARSRSGHLVWSCTYAM